MHVKEQVKDFVHDVKRRFSRRHKRDTCSTFDSHDSSSVNTLCRTDDSSSVSSYPDASQRSRFIKFIRPRTPKKHDHNVLHKARTVGNKRYRLFSAPTIPSERIVESNHKQPVSYQDPGSHRLRQDVAGERQMFAPFDYSDVIDVSACGSFAATVTSEAESTPSDEHKEDSDSLSQSQPQFDTESRSDTSRTLVTSTEHKKSASESDSRFDSLDLHSDLYSAKSHDSAPLAVDPMTDPVPSPDSRALAPSPSPPPQATTPVPVSIPRLTAPCMFLPIPNTDPLSALLTKYVPAEQRPRRDVAGEYAGRDVHEMVMSNSWRALARLARDRIVASDPDDLARILDLWSLRLSALARLRLTNQASAECTNLFAVLNTVPAASVSGTISASGVALPSLALPSSPAPAASSPLSPLSGLAQLPGTPSQKPSSIPPSLAASVTTTQQGTHELVHPFELTVFHARVHYWSGDLLGYVDALSRILKGCKERAREEARVVAQCREFAKSAKARGDADVESITRPEQTSESGDENEGENEEDAKESTENDGAQDEEEEEPDGVLVAAEANLSMWLERIARVCLILASQMIEMNDYQAAINLLAPLCAHRATATLLPAPSAELHSALARVYLLSGNLHKAEEHFSTAASAAANSSNGADIIAMNTALLAAASGDWPRAEEALSDLIARDPGNFTAINNLAVTLLCQGRIKEGIDRLEEALETSPSSVVVAEPFLFNLSTLYELRSSAPIDKKRELLVEVAKWSGDGLKTSCLKMPSS